jgi:hypothetical protein
MLVDSHKLVFDASDKFESRPMNILEEVGPAG